MGFISSSSTISVDRLTEIHDHVASPEFKNIGGTYHRFRVQNLPIDRTARRLALEENLKVWFNSDATMAYVLNTDKQYFNVYALYQSLLNIIRRGNYNVTLWWHKEMPNFLVMFKSDATSPVLWMEKSVNASTRIRKGCGGLIWGFDAKGKLHEYGKCGQKIRNEGSVRYIYCSDCLGLDD